MVRWRYCLVLALLLLLPRTGGKLDDDDDEERNEDAEEDDEDDDDDDEDETSEKPEPAGRRAPAVPPSPKARAQTRTPKKLPLECYVCAYKSETPLRSCLDPTKYRVHSITCHNVDDKCFTSVISKGKTYEAVVRGCRTGCVGSEETTCCELNRCNNQAFAMPLVPRALTAAAPSISAPASVAADSTDSTPAKSYPSTVLFFVTVLLVLQTVVKVSFV